MNESILRFSGIEWEAVAPLARQKVFQSGDHQSRLLELSPGFVESDWCRTGHIGIVVSGCFQIQFADRIEDIFEGDAISIEPGEPSKHKAIVEKSIVVLFLVEALEN